MSRPLKLVSKWAAAGLALIVTLGIAAQFWSADRFAGRIRAGLERALGRRVEFAAAHFSLFTGPGFSLSKVVIAEDPRFGREPLAYVESLEARPRLWPLLAGRLEFASLRLEDTSVNFTRVDTPEGPLWNFARLAQRTNLAGMPSVYVRSGRINFKFGDTKSVFYVTDADLDIVPPSAAGGAWQTRFAGQPARSDRPARGFGSLAAQGRWLESGPSAGRLDLDFQLEQSAMIDVLSLVSGRDLGVHGQISARLHLTGPLGNLHINGVVNVEDVHRWDLLPQHGTDWPFEFEGTLNVPAETLEIYSHSAAKEAPPLAVHFRAANYLSRPVWSVGLNWNRFRLEPLLQLARHLGSPVPSGLQMQGTLDGAIGYSGQGGWQGTLAFQDAAVAIPGSPPVRFEQAELLFDGHRVQLPSALARTPADDLARLQASYDLGTGAMDLEIATDSMAVSGLRSQVALAAVPLLDQVQSGVWKGNLKFSRDPGSAGEWSGSFLVEDAQMPLPGLSEPLQIQSARAQLNGARASFDQIQASAGDIAFAGSYRYEPGAVRPHRVQLAVPELDMAAAERLLLPTLERNRGLIARAFGRTAPAPEWLLARKVEGTLEIGSMDLAGVRLSKIKAQLIWNGTSGALAGIGANVEHGTIGGRVTVDLRSNEPAYRVAARLQAVEWHGGKFDADTVWTTAGVGKAVVANLRSDGSFSGRGFEDAPLDEFDSVSGCYQLEWATPAPRLRFTELQMSTGQELYLGRGALQDDGRLLIQVSNGTRQLSVTGTLAAMRLDESAGQ